MSLTKSLQSEYPLIAAEWDYEKNDSTPDCYAPKTHTKVWWKCKNGHEWQSMISNRTEHNRGCPYCAHQIPVKGETDFATTNPELLKEWDFSKNKIQPDEIMPGTHKKVWWKCYLGHEWQAEVKSRVNGVRCPYCASHKVQKGFNDLETISPELASEWNYEKNGPLNPSAVSYASGMKIWWKCKNGHEWQATIANRRRGSGCPKCSSALRTSFPEQAIYYYIKQAFPDAISGYKDIFDNSMELDIYIPSIKVGIEYDGKTYHKSTSNQLRDARKYKICKKNNIILIRISDMLNDSLIIKSDHKIQIPDETPKSLNFAINNLCYHLGKIVIPNVSKDRKKILACLEARKISLADEYPEIAREWDYDANYPLKPEQVAPHSNEKVGWKCLQCENKWMASIGDRTRPDGPTGCPKCAFFIGAKKNINTRIKKQGSLEQLFPELIKEWDYKKNGELNPKYVTAGSGRKVWWICNTCGYEWKTSICHRTKGENCPYCSGKSLVIGKNDLQTLFPDVADTWDYEKNGNNLPSQYMAKSGKKVWWKCNKCGYEWQAQIYSRTSGHGCQNCYNLKRKALFWFLVDK